MNRLLMIFGLILPLFFLSDAAGAQTSFSVGVVNHSNNGIQISAGKRSLRDDTIIICPVTKKRCRSYAGTLFFEVTADENIDDIATGQTMHTYYTPGPNKGAVSRGDIVIIYPKKQENHMTVKFESHGQLTVLDGKNKSIIFHCTSYEGLHIYTESKKVHIYYPLGYGVEASCPDEVFQ